VRSPKALAENRLLTENGLKTEGPGPVKMEAKIRAKMEGDWERSLEFVLRENSKLSKRECQNILNAHCGLTLIEREV
jgi:hypothetical protein